MFAAGIERATAIGLAEGAVTEADVHTGATGIESTRVTGFAEGAGTGHPGHSDDPMTMSGAGRPEGDR